MLCARPTHSSQGLKHEIVFAAAFLLQRVQFLWLELGRGALYSEAVTGLVEEATQEETNKAKSVLECRLSPRGTLHPEVSLSCAQSLCTVSCQMGMCVYSARFSVKTERSSWSPSAPQALGQGHDVLPKSWRLGLSQPCLDVSHKAQLQSAVPRAHPGMCWGLMRSRQCGRVTQRW